MTEENLHFNVSSATKSILGKDLVTNKYIAIFELVKNSYDAMASKVDIEISDDEITITDDWVWMSFEDLRDKWLYVGYSEKSDPTLKKKRSVRSRPYAWAKGIGRLACDRLGKELTLTTSKDWNCEQIRVDWWAFEADSKVNFEKINVIRTWKISESEKIVEWTSIRIFGLREKWTEDDVEKIQTHLTKLISPVKNDQDKFDVFIHFGNKKTKVTNFIFDELWLLTTNVSVKVSEDGKVINTELIDRGLKIYTTHEKNYIWDHIKGVELEMFYLSKPSKLTFHSLVKQRSVEFGSIFLYNRWFRVFPYGQQGDDSFGIDKRKGQWHSRYISSRDLIWYVSISHESDQFVETSSRSHWLLDSSWLDQLKQLLLASLRKLEGYAVETLDWTYISSEEKEVFPDDKKSEIKKLIERLAKSKHILSVDYNYGDLKESIEHKVDWGFIWALGVLKKQAKKDTDPKLTEAVEKIESAQKKQEKTIKQQEGLIETKEQEGSALKAMLSNPLFKNVIDYHHDIAIASENISDSINDSLRSLDARDYDQLLAALEIIKFENTKILSISKIATSSWMKDWVHKKKMAVNKKITDYIESYKALISALDISVNDALSSDFVLSFRYYDLVTVLDNLLSNSMKHKAKKILVDMIWNKKGITIVFSDDGKWLDKKIKDPLTIFQPRVSQTSGAGWWLYQVKRIIEEMGGTISVKRESPWVSFTIKIGNEDEI